MIYLIILNLYMCLHEAICTNKGVRSSDAGVTQGC